MSTLETQRTKTNETTFGKDLFPDHEKMLLFGSEGVCEGFVKELTVLGLRKENILIRKANMEDVEATAELARRQPFKYVVVFFDSNVDRSHEVLADVCLKLMEIVPEVMICSNIFIYSSGKDDNALDEFEFMMTDVCPSIHEITGAPMEEYDPDDKKIVADKAKYCLVKYKDLILNRE